MNQHKEAFIKAFTNRHACKEFDASKKVSEEDFNYIMEVARLSPSSFGLEPWKFLVIQNEQLREKLLPFVWGGQRQIPTASHVIIVLSGTAQDLTYPSEYYEQKLFQRRNLPADIEQTYRKLLAQFHDEDAKLLGDPRYLSDWAARQCYIALGNMMNAAALIGIDSCPIEGFHVDNLSELLAKECDIDSKQFRPAVLVTFGYRAKEPHHPKMRAAIDEVVTYYS